MKVSGFTFIRNAIRYDYPVVEAILSILPVCDEMVVAVGKSEDATRELVASIGDPKIRIIDTEWDDSLRKGGAVLAAETDKAFRAISPDSDWAFYIQADEAVHEDDIPAIRSAMERWKEDPAVEGLLFDYIHFWGSYNCAGDSRRWYRREVRIVRNDPRIRSWQDAQGFRLEGRKLNVAPAHARIFHYGWVKPPKAQQAKQQTFHRYWHSDGWIDKTIPKTEDFDYSSDDFLVTYTGTHPAVMQERIRRQDWHFNPETARIRHPFKALFLRFIEKQTGWRPGEYRNFRIIR